MSGRFNLLASDLHRKDARASCLSQSVDGLLRLHSSRKEPILASATNVFLRYGHARTTMNDIAAEAGISRPALYRVFQRKEDIFAAVIDRLIRDELQKYREAFPRLRTLDRKLHDCCEQWAGHGYDLTKAHPDARDVFNLAFAPAKQMYSTLEAFLADLLREAVAASRMRASPEKLAACFSSVCGD